MRLDAIVKVAVAERMKPGYSIAFPSNVIDLEPLAPQDG